MLRARMAGVAFVAVGLAGSAATAPLDAQIAEQVRDLDEGAVRFGYEARPDVEVCRNGIRLGDDRIRWRMDGSGNDDGGCRRGWVEVELRVRAGEVRDLDVLRADDPGRQGSVDLGRVGAAEASAYLLSLVYDGASEDAAEKAILPAMLADAGEVWPDLVAIARDGSLDRGIRKNALFWVGQEAAETVTGELADVALDEDEDQEVRNAAIFALSQRADEEAVPALMELARTAREAETRKSAMFWLAQSEDPRVVRFFEDVLLGRNR